MSHQSFPDPGPQVQYKKTHEYCHKIDNFNGVVAPSVLIFGKCVDNKHTQHNA